MKREQKNVYSSHIYRYIFLIILLLRFFSSPQCVRLTVFFLTDRAQVGSNGGLQEMALSVEFEKKERREGGTDEVFLLVARHHVGSQTLLGSQTVKTFPPSRSVPRVAFAFRNTHTRTRLEQTHRQTKLRAGVCVRCCFSSSSLSFAPCVFCVVWLLCCPGRVNSPLALYPRERERGSTPATSDSRVI